MAQQTPLYEQHTLCGARMVDFHGWMMPLHYGSQIDEHHAVRTDAGMFDVSSSTTLLKISSASLLTPLPAKKTSPGLPNTLNLSASKLLFVMTFP